MLCNASGAAVLTPSQERSRLCSRFHHGYGWWQGGYDVRETSCWWWRRWRRRWWCWCVHRQLQRRHAVQPALCRRNRCVALPGSRRIAALAAPVPVSHADFFCVWLGCVRGLSGPVPASAQLEHMEAAAAASQARVGRSSQALIRSVCTRVDGTPRSVSERFVTRPCHTTLMCACSVAPVGHLTSPRDTTRTRFRSVATRTQRYPNTSNGFVDCKSNETRH